MVRIPKGSDLQEKLRDTTKKVGDTARSRGSEALTTASEALKDGSRATGRMLKTVSESANEQALKAVDAVSEVSGQFWDQVRDRGRNTSEALFQASKEVVNRLLPESRVQAFLLPTGSGSSDFFCTVDFQSLVHELAAGRFHRPSIEIWAARDDMDLRVLAPALRQEFTQQLQAERAQMRSQAEQRFLPALEGLRAKKDKAGSLVEKSTIALTSSLMLMFLLTNPIFDLIFLVLAVFSGTTGLTKAFRHLQLTGKIRGNQKSLKRERKALEAQLDTKNKEFLAALEKIEIKIHPVLERILVNISDLDGTLWIPQGDRRAEAECPRVDPHLKSTRYRRRVAEMYLPLIDVEM